MAHSQSPYFNVVLDFLNEGMTQDSQDGLLANVIRAKSLE